MKTNLYRSLLLILSMVFASGCSDFIDLAPVSNANVENFYKTPEDINNAVIAAYKIHKQIYSTLFCSQSVLDEIRSDNTTMVQLDIVDRFTRDIGKEWWGWSWDKSYRAIYMSNLAIEKAQAVEMSDQLRNQYIGEARFLRAITYFELVRNFGGVPLVTATPESTNPEDLKVPRNTADEIYSQIVEDLQFAAANLPAQYPESQEGRATKGAAQGMLGKVYLTMGRNSDAIAELQKVVNSGLYGLMPTYAEAFDVDNRNSQESLFELQFKATTDGSPMQNTFASINAVDVPGGGLGYNLATMDLVNAYEEGDARKDVTLKADPNGQYYTTKYDDPSMTSANNSNHFFPIMRYSEVLLLLAEAQGESDDSYDLINLVRERADLDPIDENTPGTFEEKLLHERRVELAFENHRWHDLLRFGVAIPVMNAHFASMDMAITIDEDDLLMPIPQTALNTNPNLDQNPGY